MKRIETVVQQFRYMEEVLGSCCDRGRNHAMLDVLQDALDNISSSDILGELRNVWEEQKQFQQQKNDMHKEVSEKKTEA